MTGVGNPQSSVPRRRYLLTSVSSVGFDGRQPRSICAEAECTDLRGASVFLGRGHERLKHRPYWDLIEERRARGYGPHMTYGSVIVVQPTNHNSLRESDGMSATPRPAATNPWADQYSSACTVQLGEKPAWLKAAIATYWQDEVAHWISTQRSSASPEGR